MSFVKEEQKFALENREFICSHISEEVDHSKPSPVVKVMEGEGKEKESIADYYDLKCRFPRDRDPESQEMYFHLWRHHDGASSFIHAITQLCKRMKKWI